MQSVSHEVGLRWHEFLLIVLGIVVLLVMAMYLGASIAALNTCQSLGFEYGTYVLLPEQQAECEYRLRVPLHEVLPPITEGGE